MSITSAGRRVGSSLVGDGAVVDGVTLSQCVIGAGAVLAPGAVLDRCVVWPESRLAVPQRLANSILTPWGAYVIDGPQVRALALVG
jgi:ADP-glucose pyrophosphorylase